MRTLSQYIDSMCAPVDAHVHLFYHNENLEDYVGIPGIIVGFDDVDPGESTQNTIERYRKFIQASYDPNRHVLLAAGYDADSVITLYNEFPEIFRGFGEVKFYRSVRDVSAPYKSKAEFTKLCNAAPKGFPILFHWTIDNVEDIDTICKLVESYPNVTFVWCHCGFPKKTDMTHDEIHQAVSELQRTHKNLWCEISYTSLWYYFNNIGALSDYDTSRLTAGSDITVMQCRNNKQKALHQLEMKSGIVTNSGIPFDDNARTLFGL